MSLYQVVVIEQGEGPVTQVLEDEEAQDVLADFFAGDGEPLGRAIVVRRFGAPDSIRNLVAGTMTGHTTPKTSRLTVLDGGRA